MKKSYAPHKTKVVSNHAYQNTTISDVKRNTSASSNWSERSAKAKRIDSLIYQILPCQDGSTEKVR
jgi:hypothetical protein